MSGTPDLVATLMRQWRVSSAMDAESRAVGQEISLCRWRHSLPEQPDIEMPADTLVFMLSASEATRYRGRVVEQATARRGGLGLLPRGSYGRWSFEHACDSPHEVLHMYFTPEYMRRLVEQGHGKTVELREQLDLRDHRLQVLAHEINAALDDDCGSRLYLDGLLTAVAARLLDTHGAHTAPCGARGGLAPWQLKRACEAMEDRLHEDIGLDTLARIANCSPTHFSRAFKESTGVPPFQWLQQRRIARAQALLLDPRQSLCDVALAVGFGAQPQFTTAFRRVTGITPGAWRRERCA